MQNYMEWPQTRAAKGNSFQKPFVVQMLSPKGWLHNRKVNGELVTVRYDREYVVAKTFNELIQPFENTMMLNEEVLETVLKIVCDAMKYRDPQYVVPVNDIKQALGLTPPPAIELPLPSEVLPTATSESAELNPDLTHSSRIDPRENLLETGGAGEPIKQKTTKSK